MRQHKASPSVVCCDMSGSFPSRPRVLRTGHDAAMRGTQRVHAPTPRSLTCNRYLFVCFGPRVLPCSFLLMANHFAEDTHLDESGIRWRKWRPGDAWTHDEGWMRWSTDWWLPDRAEMQAVEASVQNLGSCRLLTIQTQEARAQELAAEEDGDAEIKEYLQRARLQQEEQEAVIMAEEALLRHQAEQQVAATRPDVALSPWYKFSFLSLIQSI